MDIFRFKNPNHPVKMEQGEIINGLKSKMWIERFTYAGEFTLTGYVSEGVRDKLPIGSFISHTESEDIMIVENHELTENKNEEALVTITGRSFETIFEQRVVGMNKTFPVNTGVKDYEIADNYSWNQARDLIRKHVYSGLVSDPDNAIPYLEISAADVPTPGTSEERSLKQGYLYERLIELLNIDNLGIRVIRPGPWSPVMTPGNILVLIHKGVDRRKNIVFSHDTGEIESADYLWSNKKLKNAALVSGKWVETTVELGPVGIDRRMLYVDASDIDNARETAPTGDTLTAIVNKMKQRGRAAIAAQREKALAKAEIAPNADNKKKFREDFNVGDLIAVTGDYNTTRVMRVTEYVEIEDETGFTGTPTLDLP